MRYLKISKKSYFGSVGRVVMRNGHLKKKKKKKKKREKNDKEKKKKQKKNKFTWAGGYRIDGNRGILGTTHI